METLQESNRFLTRTLRWLGFEAIAYQLLLLGHQLLLFRVAESATYGLIGATFSVVFLAVGIADCGFEMSISPFFYQLRGNRTTLCRFLFFNMLPGLVLWFIVSIVLITLKFAVSQLSSLMLVLLSGLILIETLRKPLRTVLHLAFLNKEVALVEVGSVVGYIATLWGLYALGFPVCLELVFVPLLVWSLVAVVILSWVFFLFLSRLAVDDIPAMGWMRIVRLRFFNYCTYLSHVVFSSNFLVPFFALQFGLVYAGVFKLMSHIAYSITTIVRKIFGVTSDAMLSRAREMTLESRRNVFLQLTQRLHAVVYGILIFLCVNYSKLIAYQSSSHTVVSGPVMYLFLLICFSETLFIAYEKFYITHEYAGRLFAFNLCSLGLTYLVILSSSHLSVLMVLCALVMVRVGMFAVLGMFSFYTWRIRPHFWMRPAHIALALGIAWGFFIFF